MDQHKDKFGGLESNLQEDEGDDCEKDVTSDGQLEGEGSDQLSTTHSPTGTYPRSCVMRTVSLFVMFFCMGLSASLAGTTLVSLERLLNATTSQITLSHVVSAAAWIVGSFLCSAMFDRVNGEIQLAVTSVLSSAAGACSPFTGELYGYIILSAVQSAALAYVISGANSYAMTVWDKHHLKEPLMQGLQATWSVASIVSPFIVRPFLVNLKTELVAQNDTMNSSSFLVSTTTEGLIETNNVTLSLKSVVFAYVTGNSFLGASGLLFACLYVGSGHSCRYSKTQNKDKDKEAESSKKNKLKPMRPIVKVAFLSLLSLYFGVYSVVEDCPNLYLPPFVVKGLAWSNRSGPLVAAVLMGALCIGRLINIGVSILFKPRTMLLFNMFLTAFSFILMCFVQYHDVIMWVSTSLAGFAMGSIYATTILWVGGYMKVTGFVSGLMSAGEAITSLVSPPLIGYFFDNDMPMAVIYYMMGNSLLQVILFFVMWLVLIIGHPVKTEESKDDNEIVALNTLE